jgi:hypothetical protein
MRSRASRSPPARPARSSRGSARARRRRRSRRAHYRRLALRRGTNVPTPESRAVIDVTCCGQVRPQAGRRRDLGFRRRPGSRPAPAAQLARMWPSTTPRRGPAGSSPGQGRSRRSTKSRARATAARSAPAEATLEPTALTCAPAESHSPNTTGTREEVTVQTMSAPETASRTVLHAVMGTPKRAHTLTAAATSSAVLGSTTPSGMIW